MLTTLFVSAQVALPEWVRGRGLADLPHGLFRRDDRRQRDLGQDRQPGGHTDGALHRRGGRIPRAGARPGAASCRPRPASTCRPPCTGASRSFVQRVGRRPGADPGHRRIPRRSRRPGRLPRARCARSALERKRDGAYAWFMPSRTPPSSAGSSRLSSSSRCSSSSTCAPVSPTPTGWQEQRAPIEGAAEDHASRRAEAEPREAPAHPARARSRTNRRVTDHGRRMIRSALLTAVARMSAA